MRRTSARMAAAVSDSNSPCLSAPAKSLPLSSKECMAATLSLRISNCCGCASLISSKSARVIERMIASAPARTRAEKKCGAPRITAASPRAVGSSLRSARTDFTSCSIFLPSCCTEREKETAPVSRNNNSRGYSASTKITSPGCRNCTVSFTEMAKQYSGVTPMPNTAGLRSITMGNTSTSRIFCCTFFGKLPMTFWVWILWWFACWNTK
mmetsp:Transcript_9424/g.27241  ORF Transcript_9424/g.27241 Transcript_9424/m.27241 type:complete len:210 (+) Transcript_9424:828-1457(+)